jgi:hypothetical protein
MSCFGESSGPAPLCIVSCRELIAAGLGASASWSSSGGDERHLYAALGAAGVPFHVRAWDDPAVDWAAYALVFVRTCWDYSDSEARAAAFAAWLARASAVTRVDNPASLMTWNIHKAYLAEIARVAAGRPAGALGCGHIPTVAVPGGRPTDLAALLAAQGWADAMVKPAVGGGSRACARVRRGDPGELRAAQALVDSGADFLVQPFLGAVAEGEVSVVCIGGAASHAVRKVPAPGEWRCQEEFNAVATAGPPPAGLAAAAEAVLRAAAECAAAGGLPLPPPLAARVDFLGAPAAPGGHVVLEVECIEPSLFLGPAADAGIDAAGALAGVVAAWVAAAVAARGGAAGGPPGGGAGAVPA